MWIWRIYLLTLVLCGESSPSTLLSTPNKTGTDLVLAEFKYEVNLWSTSKYYPPIFLVINISTLQLELLFKLEHK